MSALTGMVFESTSIMKKATLIIITGLICFSGHAQDSAMGGKVTIIKDNRLDELARKEAVFNEVLSKKPRAGKGYRLMLLSTNDRTQAMNVRAKLLQRYPDQKVYTIFQPPYIKLKFGDFVEKADAENVRKDIIKTKLLAGNIYVVPDTIEVKPDKTKEEEK